MSTSYQSGVRLREGSDVTLIATSSVPLGDAEVLLKTDEKEPSEIELEYSSDRQQVQFTIPNFNAATTVNVVPRDIDGISAQAPYRYFLGVVLDELPELEVALKGIGSSITPKAKLPITVNATDDYGITDVTLSVTPANQNSEDPPSTNENDATTSATTSPEIDRNGAGSAELDLKNLTDGGRLSEILPGNAINLIGEATDGYNLGDNHITRSEVFRLEVVTAEQLLALLERRELGLRSRLEQTIEEMTSLRQTLDQLRRQGFENSPDSSDADQMRAEQVRRLRVQQCTLQATKTSEELTGIANSLDDILLEMINNRVDSIDRSQRIASGVRDPIKQIVNAPMKSLIQQIRTIESQVGDPTAGIATTTAAVSTTENIIVQLNAILEKMLDLETYNEVLDLVRQLMDDQTELTEATKEERKKQVLDLFK